jgi:hypothetical protein
MAKSFNNILKIHGKKLLIVIVVVWIGLFVLGYYLGWNKSWRGPINEEQNAGAILRGWLSQRDPELFKRCKLFINFDTDGAVSEDGKHRIIIGELCGGPAKFWINKENKTVDCYLSYCGKNIGKKYCDQEIADNLCMQQKKGSSRDLALHM